MEPHSFLPPGFPVADREVLEKLRASIMNQVKTKHPPEWAELAVAVAAEEVGVDLYDIDVGFVWGMPPEGRAAFFARLGALVGEATR